MGILEPSVSWPLPPTSSKSQPPHIFTVCSTQREALAILCGSAVYACLCLCSPSAQKVLPHHQASLPPPHLSSSPPHSSQAAPRLCPLGNCSDSSPVFVPPCASLCTARCLFQARNSVGQGPCLIHPSAFSIQHEAPSHTGQSVLVVGRQTMQR